MIDKMEIMKQIEHMPEQREEREKENMLKHKIVMYQHEVYMLKMEENLLLSREKHELYLTDLRIQMQEIRARTPKRQIYFGKVKTE